MTEFEKLNPAVQHHIVNSLGWPRLRPLQEQAIAPVLDGQNALLLAPTAGGKTEAALFPLLTRMLDESWHPLSVIYLCPIKALLNNLEHRLREYAQWLGRTVGIWHGDIKQSARDKILANPPDILLATPESLEVMLVSVRSNHRELFRNLKAVVIDEIHAFAGDDRGWHLLAVLDRIEKVADRKLQRLGLSATVGNPKELLIWLQGPRETHGVVISPLEVATAELDVSVDFVGNIENAAVVISRLHRGEKRLVFCDSRSQTEALGNTLRGLGVETFVSHSSLSADERKRAEAAFAEARNCVIIATSTLELGIDVGDLDRVIQIDCPTTVASFLQRLGRTGRRAGTSRNCLFLVTSEGTLVRTIALLNLWAMGYVEPVVAPPKPFHLIAQQLIALALQESELGEHTWPEWIAGVLERAGITADDVAHLTHHMVTESYLQSDEGLLAVGKKAEKNFGHKNFMSIYSIFDSPPLFRVLHGRIDVGSVHELSFQTKKEGDRILSLAGRYWRVTYIDWKRRQAYVEPTEIRGKSVWKSGGMHLRFELCQSIRRVLGGEESAVKLSERGRSTLENVIEEFQWVDVQKTTLLNTEKSIEWWTFAGGILNEIIAERLTGSGYSVNANSYCIEFREDTKLGDARKAVEGVLHNMTEPWPHNIDDGFTESLKFGECLDVALMQKHLKSRFEQHDPWHKIVAQQFHEVENLN